MADIDCGSCDCGSCDCGNCDCGDCDCGDCCGECDWTCGCCGDGGCCGGDQGCCGEDGCCGGDQGCCGCGHCYCPFFCPAPDLPDHGHHGHGDGCNNPCWTWLYCDGCYNNSSSQRRRQELEGRYEATGALAANGQLTPNMEANGDPQQLSAPGNSADVVTSQPPPSYEEATGGNVITTQPNSRV